MKSAASGLQGVLHYWGLIGLTPVRGTQLNFRVAGLPEFGSGHSLKSGHPSYDREPNSSLDPTTGELPKVPEYREFLLGCDKAATLAQKIKMRLQMPGDWTRSKAWIPLKANA